VISPWRNKKKIDNRDKSKLLTSSNNPRGRGNLLRQNINPVHKNKSTVKKELKDFNYYLGTSQQATEYKMTTEFIKNHIKKEFDYENDIATALDNLQEFRITDLQPILLIWMMRMKVFDYRKISNMNSNSRKNSQCQETWFPPQAP
jgi:hypothetical protein